MFGFLDFDDRIAVRHQNGTLSYREFIRLLGLLGDRLGELGLRPGDRVAFILPNSLELLASYYACLMNGYVAVPINERLTRREIQTVLGHSRPRCIVTSPSRVPELESGIHTGDQSLEAPEVLALNRLHAWLDSVSADLPTRAIPRWPPDHPAILFYTSGSTGAPKGVLYTHRTLTDNSRIYGKAMGISADDHSVLCHCMASNFIFAQVTVPVLDRGGIVEVTDFGSVEETLDAIDAGATFLSLIPWFGFQLIEAASGRPAFRNRLRACAVGGDRVPLSYFDEFEDVFGIVPREHLGMAETNVSAVNPPEGEGMKIGSVGTAIPEVTTQVRDPHGSALPVGKEGEIWVHTPAALEEYWQDPVKTREVLVDGWVATGDAGRLDEDGYLWLSGRLKQIIICDGDNIHPREVEHEIVQHPLVARACVVGVPHPTRGETVGAAVILEEPDGVLTQPELAHFLKDRLTEVKIPAHLLVLDQFPETPIGKIDRRVILSSLRGATNDTTLKSPPSNRNTSR